MVVIIEGSTQKFSAKNPGLRAASIGEHMLKVAFERVEFRGNKCGHTREMTPDGALDSLLFGWFGWGAIVEEVTSTKLVVISNEHFGTESMTWEGSEAEMLPLVHAATVFHFVCNDEPEQMLKNASIALGRATGGQPIATALLAGLFVGTPRLKTTLLILENVTDEADIKAGMKLKAEDLNAALQLRKELNAPLHEVLAQLAA
jgi:hypothetical protein